MTSDLQKQIEKTVTNGVGYRGFSQKDIDRATNPFFHEDDLDLQAHLGMMEYSAADNDFSKQILLHQVMDIGKIKQRLVAYGLENQVNFQTPDEVNSAITQMYQNKERIKSEKESPYGSILIKNFDPDRIQTSAIRDLELSLNAKPLKSFRVMSKEDEQREFDRGYASRISEINQAERRFNAQVSVALDDSVISSSDAFKYQTGSMFSPFERLKEKARQDYRF